jgi:hypothetical protein
MLVQGRVHTLIARSGLTVGLLVLGVVGIPSYARLLEPGVEVVSRGVARREAWRFESLNVVSDSHFRGARFELATAIPAPPAPPAQSAHLVTRKSAAGAARTLIAMLAILGFWPSARPMTARLGAAALVAYLLSSVEIGFALQGESAVAAAQLTGDPNAVPALARWADFTESGGSLALAVAAGLLLVAVLGRLGGPRARPGP